MSLTPRALAVVAQQNDSLRTQMDCQSDCTRARVQVLPASDATHSKTVWER
ncbi:hypothetical protein H0A65_10945 [Alcaligenaceae bacterium]|nr:hypothetical protein [Alcaligenaceae bacterium]